jgi:predicted RNase H-like nuclease (RuvC/YqgF family)
LNHHKLRQNTLSYHNLKSEVKSLEAKKESLIRIIQDYDDQVKALGKSFDSYCRLCREEEHKLADLQRKRLQAESLASHFENNNEEYLMIRNVVEHKVCSTLSNAALLLKFAVSSVMHSIRNNPG